MLIGIVVNRREVRRVARGEKLYIFMERKDFEDHEFHCVQRLVRVIIEGIEAHVFKDSKDKYEVGVFSG